MSKLHISSNNPFKALFQSPKSCCDLPLIDPDILLCEVFEPSLGTQVFLNRLYLIGYHGLPKCFAVLYLIEREYIR